MYKQKYLDHHDYAAKTNPSKEYDFVEHEGKSDRYEQSFEKH